MTEKSLLLGNGWNQFQGNKKMGNRQIKERFFECIKRHSPLYQVMFDIEIDDRICKEIEEQIGMDDNDGIEKIADIFFELMCKKKSSISIQGGTSASCLLYLIKASSINAIFYEGQKRITLSKEKPPKLKEYFHIFTLNYMEIWDDSNLCCHLHGQYEPETVISEGEKDIVLYETRYMHISEYSKVVNEMKELYEMVPISCESLVFSPEFLKKQESLTYEVKLSNYLYPGNTTFPMDDSKKLYQELEGIANLEILGMSPYGDDDLINQIKKFLISLCISISTMSFWKINV